MLGSSNLSCVVALLKFTKLHIERRLKYIINLFLFSVQFTVVFNLLAKLDFSLSISIR